MYESRGHQLTGDKHAAYDAPSSTTASPLHHDAHHDVHRDVHHDAHHDAQQLPIAPDGDMHDTAAYHVPTHRNVTSVWVKCFSAERAAALLVDREDPLDVVRGKIEAALYPNGWAATSAGAAATSATADIKSSSTRKRLQIDYLDAYGQRVRIDSQERWNTAVATYLHMKRNFVYVFCDAYPVVNGASSKGKSGVSFGAAWSRASPSAASASAATSPAPTSTATPASSSGNTGNVPSARDTDNTIHISDERRALRLIQKATPAPPKFRRPTTSVPSWTDERLKENGVLARLQREIQHREKLLLDKRRAGTASASAASQSVRHGHDSRDAEVTTSMDSVNSEDIGARPRSVLLRVDSSYERDSAVLASLNRSPVFDAKTGRKSYSLLARSSSFLSNGSRYDNEQYQQQQAQMARQAYDQQQQQQQLQQQMLMFGNGQSSMFGYPGGGNAMPYVDPATGAMLMPMPYVPTPYAFAPPAFGPSYAQPSSSYLNFAQQQQQFAPPMLSPLMHQHMHGHRSASAPPSLSPYPLVLPAITTIQTPLRGGWKQEPAAQRTASAQPQQQRGSYQGTLEQQQQRQYEQQKHQYEQQQLQYEQQQHQYEQQQHQYEQQQNQYEQQQQQEQYYDENDLLPYDDETEQEGSIVDTTRHLNDNYDNHNDRPEDLADWTTPMVETFAQSATYPAELRMSRGGRNSSVDHTRDTDAALQTVQPANPFAYEYATSSASSSSASLSSADGSPRAPRATPHYKPGPPPAVAKNIKTGASSRSITSIPEVEEEDMADDASAPIATPTEKKAGGSVRRMPFVPHPQYGQRGVTAAQ